MTDQIAKFKEFFAERIEEYKASIALDAKEKEAFLNEYPLARIKELTAEEFCLGSEQSKNSFCYLIEFGKYKHTGFGIGGGSAKKFGIYYSKAEGCYKHGNDSIGNIEDFWPQFRNEMCRFIEDSGSADKPVALEDYPLLQGMAMVLTKLLCIYYPLQYCAIGSDKVLKKLIENFGYKYDGALRCHQLNYFFNKSIRADIPEFNEVNDLYLGRMAWDYIKTESPKPPTKKPDIRKETATDKKEPVQQINGYKNPFSSMLIESKNLIFRGAPGTGKTYLAKEIAADIISNGSCADYMQLTEEQKQQVEFVQFHPSYDYSDFVEGLRPKVNDDGTMGFELQDGIFKRFVARARKNYEDSQKTKETIEKEASVQGAMMDFFSSIELGVDTFRTINGNEFTITSVDDKHINISIPRNATVNKISLNIDELRRMLESDATFSMIKDITAFFGKTFATQAYSYDFAIYKAIKAKKGGASKAGTKTTETTELKKYIFIIDEINRGEISKIFVRGKMILPSLG